MISYSEILLYCTFVRFSKSLSVTEYCLVRDFIDLQVVVTVLQNFYWKTRIKTKRGKHVVLEQDDAAVETQQLQHPRLCSSD